MIELSIGTVEEHVIVAFPGPVIWLSFTPEQARLLAARLWSEAETADRSVGGKEYVVPWTKLDRQRRDGVENN